MYEGIPVLVNNFGYFKLCNNNLIQWLVILFIGLYRVTSLDKVLRIVKGEMHSNKAMI